MSQPKYSTYMSVKELPGIEVGDKITVDESGEFYSNKSNTIKFSKNQVETSGWFSPVDDSITIVTTTCTKLGKVYENNTLVKKICEDALNGRMVSVDVVEDWIKETFSTQDELVQLRILEEFGKIKYNGPIQL